MTDKLASFQKIADIFSSNGYSLYLVGGTVRDYLLSLPITDVDLVTNATPDEMLSFLSPYKINSTFKKYGSIKIYFEDSYFDVTTLRKEKKYRDSRHPQKIIFVKSLKQDYKRRDFTINSMYMDTHFRVIDYVHGMVDINNSLIRMVGNPNRRIKEDPLRIIRALRFSLDFDFNIEKHLEKAIRKHIKLLTLLSEDKIRQDIHKIKTDNKQKVISLFDEYGMHYLTNMIE